ncbi:hypothetical protein DPMN_074095 [Dreissena polymorpha]|uniref:Uncharacterized protein n=1 Tax=Dreissena polymorpha TaxID=45954 RepID=A0A9D3YFK7_DREPO|nr:hypothetical protein DPMN_074095 [Dreissena polymorpha]
MWPQEKNAPPPGGHIFQATGTIFDLFQDIIGTNLLTMFHEDRTINVASRVLTMKNAPPYGSHDLQPTSIIFELVQNIFGMNLLTKFHEDGTINVASRVFTRFYYGTRRVLARKYKEKCPAPWRPCFSCKLIQDIIETNLLTKFHEDRTVKVTSRVFTRLKLTPHDAQRTKGDHKSSPYKAHCAQLVS